MMNHMGIYMLLVLITYANHIEIKHGCGSELSVYIPSKQRGMNILRQIYHDKIIKDLPKEKDMYLENICKQLIDKNILIDIDVLDGEVYFIFNANMIDYIAKLVKAKTSGASISPFSTKNLPKSKYTIPNEDLLLYQNAVKNCPKKNNR